MTAPVCETCGQSYDPEIRRLRELLKGIGDDWGVIATEMHASMDRLNVRKNRRRHVELVLHHFYAGLQRQAGLRRAQPQRDNHAD